MKKLRGSTGFKIFLVIIVNLTALASGLGLAANVYAISQGYFQDSLDSIRESAFAPIIRNDIDSLTYYLHLYAEGTENELIQNEKEYYESDNTNFFFIVYDDQGGIVLQSFTDQYSATETVKRELALNNGTTAVYTIQGFVRSDLIAQDNYYRVNLLVELFYNHRHTIIIATIVALVLLLTSFILLMKCAGYRKGRDEVKLSFFDKIPLELMTLICFLFTGPLINIAFGWYYYQYYDNIWSLILFLMAAFQVGLFYVTSLARRIKANVLWKNTIIYWTIDRSGRSVKFFLQNRPIMTSATIIYFIVCVIELFFISIYDYHGSSLKFFWFIEKVLIFALIIYLIYNLRTLLRGAEAIASGDLDFQIDTTYLVSDFRKAGNHLNRIGLSMNEVVDERMKSERMKTELITNVSHDIKTPLTSIINYVDLLKKQPIEDETTLEYVDVLDRQSARLKKLIEDLVSASKAASGSYDLQLQPLDLSVFITQITGEYEEKMTQKELELIVNKPEQPLHILADGQLIWRVFDNLLNNAYLYAQAHTRVYLTLEARNQNVVIVIKNVSRDYLNISSDELMERFVRGDSSRATEGSGLGLAIAKSMVELQKGSFDLSIDGDLFKVMLAFPLITEKGE